MLQQRQKRLYSMSRAELIAAIYERVPNRYRRLINNARPDEIRVLGCFTGNFGRQVVVRMKWRRVAMGFVRHKTILETTLLAIHEWRFVPLSRQAEYRLEAGKIRIDYKDWRPDAYPHDIPERVAKRLIERARP